MRRCCQAASSISAGVVPGSRGAAPVVGAGFGTLEAYIVVRALCNKDY